MNSARDFKARTPRNVRYLPCFRILLSVLEYERRRNENVQFIQAELQSRLDATGFGGDSNQEFNARDFYNSQVLDNREKDIPAAPKTGRHCIKSHAPLEPLRRSCREKGKATVNYAQSTHSSWVGEGGARFKVR